VLNPGIPGTVVAELRNVIPVYRELSVKGLREPQEFELRDEVEGKEIFVTVELYHLLSVFRLMSAC
jgi:hypothetical protein